MTAEQECREEMRRRHRISAIQWILARPILLIVGVFVLSLLLRAVEKFVLDPML